MDIVAEIEAMRKRILDEINAEFDLLIRRATNSNYRTAQQTTEYEITYPLSASSKFFKGKKPTAIIFPDKSVTTVVSWKQVALVVLQHCVSDSDNLNALLALRGKIAGKKRVLLAEKGKDMHSPLKIEKNLYMEAHFDAETLMNVLTSRILDAINYDYSQIFVKIRQQ